MPEAHDGVEIALQQRAPLRDAARSRRRLLLEVEARAEALARAGEHDGADSLVRLRGVHRRVELAQHGGVHRVEALRPVEGDQRGRAAPLIEDGLVRHGDAPVPGNAGPPYITTRNRPKKAAMMHPACVAA